MSVETARLHIEGLSQECLYGVSAILVETVTSVKAGWVQHWFAVDQDNNVVCSLSPRAYRVCLTVAVIRAQEKMRNSVPMAGKCGESARKLLLHMMPPGDWYGLQGFNDYSGRTVDEIVEFVNKTDRLVRKYLPAA